MKEQVPHVLLALGSVDNDYVINNQLRQTIYIIQSSLSIYHRRNFFLIRCFDIDLGCDFTFNSKQK
jgi:hypothetical protein